MLMPLLQTILTSAVEYRKYNLGVYGIELPIQDPWTAQTQTIDFIVQLFELTTKVVDASASGVGMDDGSVAVRDIPRMQLAELASVLFACCHERLEWLRRSVYYLGLVSLVKVDVQSARLPQIPPVPRASGRSSRTGSTAFDPRF